jgi:cytochrome c oxidase subunit II
MFSGASNFVNNVDGITLFIFLVALFFLLGITATMIYFVVRYKKERNPKSEHITGNLTIEIIWTIIPLILVTIMFIYGWKDWKMMKSPPKNAFTISSTARMWSWSFQYPNGKVTDTLYVPLDKPIIVNVNSADVIHSMYIPAFRIKQDMVPGNKNFLWFIAQKEGIYDIFCAEYCGLRHSYMTTAVYVMPQPSFDKWYNDTSLMAMNPGTGKLMPPGMILMRKYGCIACHSVDGAKIVGPTFKGIYGQKTTVLVDGKEIQVTVDDSYILESVYDPNAKIVKGFRQGFMQPFNKEMITKKDIQVIVDYIKTLK